MVSSLRKDFNKKFTESRYADYVGQLEGLHPRALDFRVAETPVFVPKNFTDKMLSACEEIIDVIISPEFIDLTNRSIPPDLEIPGETKHSHFIAFDFGVCLDKNGEL